MAWGRETPFPIVWRGLLIGLIATILWVALSALSIRAFAILYHRQLLPNLQERAYFGEFFGIVNSAVSTLAFAALIFTLWVQHSQYREQLERTVAGSRASESLNLFRYWNSPEFLASRTLVQRHIVATDAPIFLTKLSHGNANEKAVYEAIMVILGFFVQWSALISSDLADADVLRELLGPQAHAWRNLLFDRLESTHVSASLNRVRTGFERGLFSDPILGTGSALRANDGLSFTDPDPP